MLRNILKSNNWKQSVMTAVNSLIYLIEQIHLKKSSKHICNQCRLVMTGAKTIRTTLSIVIVIVRLQ